MKKEHISNIPINKGNYTMESPEREELFEKYRGAGWEEEYKEYRNNWVRYAKEQYVSEYPLLVDIELSTVCNLICPMCYTTTDDFKSKINSEFMDFTLFTKIINEIGGKVPAIRLSLRGEATLHKKFVECIRYAKTRGIKEISFLTNGSKLSSEYFERIMEAGADWITISIDGLGDTYEAIRKPLKFNDILKNVQGIKKVKDHRGSHKPVIKIQSIWPAVRKCPQLFYDTFAPYADMIAFNPLIDYLSKDSDISYEDNFSCPQFYQRLTVGTDGRSMLCANDEVGEVIVGDTNDQTIKEIWHGDMLNNVRKLHRVKNGFTNLSLCRKCYIPRKTECCETAKVNDRELTILNYTNRAQEIGK